MQKHAFTLVELIVVITILAVLGTLGFMSFQGYSKTARDSVRLSDLTTISKALEFERTKNDILPLPDNYITITASGTILSYQGKTGNESMGKIGISEAIIDPLDSDAYIYTVNKSKTEYQLLGFLEANDSFSLQENTYADFSNRYPKSKGSNIGVILSDQTNIPITSDIDVITENQAYNIVLDNNPENTINGTGGSLSKLVSYHQNFQSCKEIKDIYGIGVESGKYMISPNMSDKISVYCDMITDGGGWSLVFNQAEIGGFWNGISTSIVNYNISGDSSCNGWGNNCISSTYSQLAIKNDIMLDGSNTDIIADNYTSRLIVNGVNQITGKTLYQVMNDGAPAINCKYNIGKADIVEKKDPYLNGGDSSHVFLVNGTDICLNDTSNGGSIFLLGRAHTNASGWPNNVYGNHMHNNYRLWIR